ncbi:MAG: glycosyltransferase family 39 protein [Acidobacteria bacterium]|nr:glycosyltransferase family 39 protein [Acidobacteriota bacterium]
MGTVASGWRSTIVWGLGALFCALFFAQGYAFIRQVGVQEDEVLFAGAVLRPFEVSGSLGTVPIMIMDYAGALKALVYGQIFRVFPPDTRSVRMPVLFLGTLTLLLYFVFFRMTLGDAGALIATALLAVDPVFVITTVLDWGIDAVQHFLAAAALLLFLLFHRRGEAWLFRAACFLCGLGLWDKVTFVWVLVAFGAGALAVFGAEVWPHLTRRKVLSAVVWMGLGAAPLIYFNVTNLAATVRGSGGVKVPGGERLAILRTSLDGSALFGYLTRQEDGTAVRAPGTGMERARVALSEAAGHPESHGLLLGCLASLLLWRSRTVRYCGIAFALGWVAMLPFAMGAGGAHHIVLLWPLPQMMVAAGLCAIPRVKPAYALAAAVMLVGWSALVTNEYYARIVTRGNVAYWSDAMEPLRQLLVETPNDGILVVDWGILGPLRTLGRGELPLQYWETRYADRVARNPNHLFVSYVERAGLPDEKYAALRRTGLREELVTEVADRNGRPVYRVVRYR